MQAERNQNEKAIERICLRVLCALCGEYSFVFRAVEVARDPVVGLDFRERGDFGGAGVELVWAAGVEVAARRRVDRAWDFPLEENALSLQRGVGHRVG